MKLQRNFHLIRMMQPRAPRLAVIAGLMMIVCSCARTQPREIPVYNEAGIPVQFKRIDKNPQLDYWVHWRRAAYDAFDNKIHYPQPVDESKVVAEWGDPMWVRSFVSLAGEHVDEWLYPDPNKLMQFIGDTMVYQGPIDDVERIMLRRGLADKVIVQTTDPSMVVQILEYTNRFGVRMDDYHFVNGRLTQAKEGN